MSMEKLELYDFDHTVYAGDATFDFYIFALKKQPGILKYMPGQLYHLVKYVLKIEDKTATKSHLLGFVASLRSFDDLVQAFWQTHQNKLAGWYLERGERSRHVIVSASPDVLLQKISQNLGVGYVIATRLDVKSGKIIGKNCHGLEKPLRIREVLPDTSFETAYSDHLSDLPMLGMAKHAYIVRKDYIVSVEEFQKLSLFERARRRRL